MEDSISTKRVEVGFGVGRLRRTRRYEAALATIRADSFRVIRVYEPYGRGGDAGRAIIDNLAYLDSLGFVPFIGISNFPYGLAPPPEQRVSGPYRHTPDQRAGIFRYSNRYPPSPAEMESLLANLLKNLDSAFGLPKLRTWYFEFGNEPDAARYFWGTPEAFDSLLTSAIRTFRTYDPGLRVGAAGFTSGIVWDVPRSPPYREIAQRLAGGAAVFVSFHIYAVGFTDKSISESIENFLDDRHRASRVISEWNVSTRTGRRVQAVLSSDRIVPHIIDILAAAHETDVTLLLIHKLMDDDAFEEPQLGLFDEAGRPKGAYEFIKSAAKMARAGYAVERTAHHVSITSDNVVWLKSLDAIVTVDTTEFAVLHSRGAKSATLRPDSWAILRRR